MTGQRKMKIIALRANAGLSQTELATKAGVQQAVISRIEKGEVEGYSIKTMKKIADFFGVKVLDIDEFSEKVMNPERSKKENGLQSRNQAIASL
jgi:transcriptional regulator with XRE-family HTH domain